MEATSEATSESPGGVRSEEHPDLQTSILSPILPRTARQIAHCGSRSTSGPSRAESPAGTPCGGCRSPARAPSCSSGPIASASVLPPIGFWMTEATRHGPAQCTNGARFRAGRPRTPFPPTGAYLATDGHIGRGPGPSFPLRGCLKTPRSVHISSRVSVFFPWRGRLETPRSVHISSPVLVWGGCHGGIPRRRASWRRSPRRPKEVADG